MMILCIRWEQYRDAIKADPYGFSGFAAADRFYGWLEGYADFCEEEGDLAHARDIRDLVYVAIELARGIRQDEMAESRQRVIEAAK